MKHNPTLLTATLAIILPLQVLAQFPTTNPFELPPTSSALPCPDGQPPSTVGLNNQQAPICCNSNLINVIGSSITCLTNCAVGYNTCWPTCPREADNEPITSGRCTPVPVTVSDYTERVYGASTTTTSVGSTSAGMVRGSTVAPTSAGENWGFKRAAVTQAPVLVVGGMVGLVLL